MPIMIEIERPEDAVTCKSCVYASRGTTFNERLGSWIMDTSGDFFKCSRFVETDTKYNPVTGKIVTNTKMPYCSSERDENIGKCGPKGNLWVPKDTKKHLFTVLKR